MAATAAQRARATVVGQQQHPQQQQVAATPYGASPVQQTVSARLAELGGGEVSALTLAERADRSRQRFSCTDAAF